MKAKINVFRTLKIWRESSKERILKERTCKWKGSKLEIIYDRPHFPHPQIDCLDCTRWHEEDTPFILKCRTCEYGCGKKIMCSKIFTPEWKNEYWLANVCPLRKPTIEDPYPSWYGISKEDFEFFKAKWLEQNREQ